MSASRKTSGAPFLERRDFSFPPSQELCKSATELWKSGQSRERRVKSSPDLSNLCSILIKISLPLPYRPPSSTPQLRHVSLCYELASCLGHCGAPREPTVGTCGRHIHATPGAGLDTEMQCPGHQPPPPLLPHPPYNYLPLDQILPSTLSQRPMAWGCQGHRRGLAAATGAEVPKSGPLSPRCAFPRPTSPATH